jgi:hypothetical protein
MSKTLNQEDLKVTGLFGKIKEKIRKRSGKTHQRQEVSADAKEGKKEDSREAIADEPKVEAARRILVVGRESVFSKEIIDYAIEMAERLSYEIVALNTAPLSCDTYKLFAASRNRICEDFENLSKKNVTTFQETAEKKGIPFTHVVKFSESYDVLKEIKVEIGEFEFVVSEIEEEGNASGREGGEKAKPEICVYSIM